MDWNLTRYDLDPSGDGASDYSAFTEEVIGRLEMEKAKPASLHIVDKKKKVS